MDNYFMTKNKSEAPQEFVARIMREKDLSTYKVEKNSRDARSGDFISQSSVSKILNGDIKNPSIPKQKALARGLDVPEEMILAVFAGKSLEPSSFEETLLVAAQGAENWTEDQRKRFIDTVRTVAAGIRAERRQEKNG